MGLLSYTKKKSQKVADYLCCCKSSIAKRKKDDKMPKEERKSKRRKTAKDNENEVKKQKKKKRSIKNLFCCVQKPSNKGEKKERKRRRLLFGRKKPSKLSKDNENELVKKKLKQKRIKTLFCCVQKPSNEGEKKEGKRRRLLFRRKKPSKLSKDNENEVKKQKRIKTTLFCCVQKPSKKGEKKERKRRRLVFGRKKASKLSKDQRRRKLKKFWRRKKAQKTANLISLVKTISFDSDSGKQRFAAEEILRIGSENIAARVFTFRELATATKNFNSENLLGEGGFGRVYKGQLKGSNEIVAVKQLDRKGFQGNREFLVEVLMLSLLHHQNLVKLLGYCTDGDQRILVYEYMSMGSLEDHLFDFGPNSKALEWHTRMKIAAGAAKGLEYLHEIATPPVIYRDFKASNILLDENYDSKLSDFGLAKVAPMGDNSHVSTRVMGTYGYCAPEYALTGKLTMMSDIYSFGVVFLELITGRKAIDVTRPKHEQHLINWAEPLFRDKRKFEAMADPLLQGKYPTKGLYQALAVAQMCLQEEATIRPLIGDVVTALEHLADPKNDDRNSPAVIPRNLSNF